MRTFIFLGVLLAGFASSSVEAQTNGGGNRAAVPNLNIKSGCRDLSNSQLNKTTNYSTCIGDEQNARTQLQKDWASFPASKHEQCMHLVTPPALPSYVALQDCLNMAREAEKVPDSIGTLKRK